MSQFSVVAESPRYLRDLKEAKKKHPAVVSELARLFTQLESDPQVGYPIPGYSRRLWGKRVGVKGRMGKRGGYRLLYFVEWDKKIVVPVCLYYKPDDEKLPARDIERLFTDALKDLGILPSARAN